MLPVNINFDGNALVKWAARPVARRAESYAKDAKRRKLIAMAKECATKLKIADWDVVAWPPEQVNMGIVDILRSTNECSSASGCAQVAAQLCGKHHPSNPVTRLVHRLFKVPRSGWDTPLSVDKGDDATDICAKLFVEFVGNDDVGSVIDELVTSESMKAKGGALFPLWTVSSELGLPFKWAESVVTTYRKEWDSALVSFVGSRTPNKDSSFELDDLFDSRATWCRHGLAMLDVLVTSRAARKLGINLFLRTDDLYRLPPPPPKGHGFSSDCWWHVVCRPLDCGVSYYREWRNVRFQVASQFLAFALMYEYQRFLAEHLRRRGSVGKMTNRLSLRNKHIFGTGVASENVCFWETFENYLPTCTIDLGADASEFGVGDVDLLTSMCKVLGGHVYPTTSIQLSIVDKTLGLNEVEKESFLGRISRRHVRLLHCGNDRALVIPYLNKIILKLSDSRWVRDNDVHALQPFEGVYNEAAIRRAANVLLGMEYRKGVGAVVNEMALAVLKQYARRGELYSMELRDHMLSVLVVEDRVCIRALTTWARDVFGKDFKMVAGVVREMIHDRLFCKGDIGSERMMNENDAYYDAVYLRRNYTVKNNVDWGPGVPMAGISPVARTKINNGVMGGLVVTGILCGIRGSGVERLALWYLNYTRGGTIDVDKSTIFLSDPYWNQKQVQKLPGFTEFTGSYNYFGGGDKVGRYCPTMVTKAKSSTSLI